MAKSQNINTTAYTGVIKELVMSKSRESIDILNGMILEIQTSIAVIMDYEISGGFEGNENFRKGVYSLCLKSIMLNLAKFIEYHEKYNEFLKSIIPEHNELRKSMASELLGKGVKEFRNKYLAHVRCKKNQKALSHVEIDAYIERIIGGRDAIKFFEWLSPKNPSNVQNEHQFLSRVVAIRDSILKHL